MDISERLIIVKVEIEIDPACIPAGYEAVAARVPVAGEPVIGEPGQVETAHSQFSYVYLIVRKVYTPPPFFGPGWYAMDLNGRWFSYETEPQKGNAYWVSDGSAELISNRIIWEKPPGDWTQSKFQVKGGAT